MCMTGWNGSAKWYFVPSIRKFHTSIGNLSRFFTFLARLLFLLKQENLMILENDQI